MNKTLLKFYLIITLTCGPLFSFIVLDSIYPLKTFDPTNYSTIIAARDDTPLRSFPDQNGVWRSPVTLDQVSPLYIEALLGYEDRYFYYHPGINPFALFRAYKLNKQAGKIISGGSTITMQTARLLHPHSRSYGGKIQQIFRALQLEFHYSKNEILEIYLNIAPFGGTQQGIGAASLRYLGKSPRELSHSEAALLAILPQAPSRLRPDRYPKRAAKARNKLLNRLSQRGIWATTTCKEAKQELIVQERFSHPQLAPLLARRLRPLAQPGVPLITTIDAEMQQSLSDFAKDYVLQLPQSTSVGLLVVENNTMAVRTYIGSADFLNKERFGHVDMVLAIRSPGSTLKPFLYGMGLDLGLIHSHSLLSDSPRLYGDYQPENFSGGFTGPVTVSHALRHSLNIPALQLMEKIGPAAFASRLQAGGFKLTLPGNQRPNLAVILGGVGVNLKHLVEAYSSLARHGQSGSLRFLQAELNQPIRQKRMMSDGASWIIRNILKDNPRPDRYRTQAIATTPIAWKTGTSYGFRDTWAIGVTPRYTIGVWIGRPDGTPIPGHSGGITAAPLLLAIADSLIKPGEYFPPPPKSVTRETICWPLGLKDTGHKELCHERHRAFILDNTIPPTFASADERDWLVNPVTINIDPQSGLQVPAGCNKTNTIKKYIALWPKAVEPWIEPSLRRSGQIPAVSPACQNQSGLATGNLKITGIKQNSVFYFGINRVQINLRAMGGLGTRYWFLDGEFILKKDTDSSYLHNITKKGEHQLTVRDSLGNTDMVIFTVQ
jgi:penicillin-binding protein 1C